MQPRDLAPVKDDWKSVYLLLLLVGAFGFVAMTFLGISHGLGGHSSGGHSPVGHGHAGHAGHALSHPARAATALLKGAGRSRLAKSSFRASMAGLRSDPWQLIMAVSPIDVFAVIMGAGATGIVLKPWQRDWPLGVAAFLGGLAFVAGIIRPTMGFLMRFASKPSEGLEGEVSSIAEAATRFDANGRGLIKVILDEQIVQLLATLDSSERENGVQVSKGEKVVIVSVDPTRNTCVVSRELAPPFPDEDLADA